MSEIESFENRDTITFFKVYPASIAPMRADKAALGVMPTMAFRHCEPMRSASSFGWYIFPPEDIFLKWNGSDVFYLVNEEWQPLSQFYPFEFREYWNKNAPGDLHDLMPPMLSILPIKGYVQIWSGLLCATKSGWSSLIRPLVNLPNSHLYRCFEGIIESDHFGPFPLFMNIQLIATDVIISIPKTSPLFQVQPLLRECYTSSAHEFSVRHGLGTQDDGTQALSGQDWSGYRKTIRKVDIENEIETGIYTGATRKRSKGGNE